MNCTQLFRMVQHLFEDERIAKKAAMIMAGILKARSPRLSEIAHKMRGNSDANYKMIQRFLDVVDPREQLRRLFNADQPFVLGDVTEISRPQAHRTPYVGKLKDGKTKGFWILTLGVPHRGRAIPFHFVTYSSRTIAEENVSRNMNHFKAFGEIKALLGQMPIVLDREFSYLELLERLVADGVNFVIRLNMGSRPPTFLDHAGRRLELVVSPGKQAIYNQVFYKGRVRVNVIGTWKKGLSEPLWVMSNLSVEQGLQTYTARMKIEETFRDLKSLLRLDTLMNKKQINMEKMVALVMLAFSVGLLVGEQVRDILYGLPIHEGETVPEHQCIPNQPYRKKGPRWPLYSGLFILLRQRARLSQHQWRQIFRSTRLSLHSLAQQPVRTLV